MENRKRGIQYPEEPRILSGTYVQQGLPGDKKSLLPDTDRSYDSTDNGSNRKAVEKSKAEQGAEASENTGIMENRVVVRIYGGNGKTVSDKVYLKIGQGNGVMRKHQGKEK